MPSKFRITLNCSPELYRTIKRDSEINHRSDSNQAVFVLEQYYQARKRDADLFTPQQPSEEERAPHRFGNDDEPVEEPQLKRRSHQDKDQS